jgi:hypothetical protein
VPSHEGPTSVPIVPPPDAPLKINPKGFSNPNDAPDAATQPKKLTTVIQIAPKSVPPTADPDNNGPNSGCDHPQPECCNDP